MVELKRANMVVHEFLGKTRLARGHRKIQTRAPAQRNQTDRHRAERRPLHGAIATAPTETLNQPLPRRRPSRQRRLDALDQFRRRLDAQVGLPESRAHLTVTFTFPLTLFAAGQMTLEFERFREAQFLIEIA